MRKTDWFLIDLFQMKKKIINFTIMYIGQKMDFDRNRTTEPVI
jgi:hypothetical protein